MYVYFFQTYLGFPHFFQNPANGQMFWTISVVIRFPLMLQPDEISRQEVYLLFIKIAKN
jgi:hypothetical protein